MNQPKIHNLHRGGVRRRGFSLIELVVVIAVTSIVAGLVASFSARPLLAYADVSRRAELIDAADGRDDLDVIHAEVYVDPSEFSSGGFPDLTPIVQATNLPFEPALFVLDGDGTVQARLDTTFDRSELAEALSLV